MVRFWMLVLGLMAGLSDRAFAQVVPDLTLPVGERSRISGTADTQIDGGAIRGSNLFHSFQQFSIPTGGSASFNNAPNITNIITRVTGSSGSNIDGLIRANGTANLFLINPNGIVFGANARLELGGSFLASTADRLMFDNEFGYSAGDPQAPPLLTISAPIGLQYGGRAGEMRSQGAILQVPTGQTLALVGGNVAIEGGELFAPGGRVELAGIATGEVGLRQQGQDWRLSVPDGLTRADVSIGGDAIVDVSSGGGGSIAITVRNFTGNGLGTGIFAGIAAGLGTVEAQAGDIDINATEVINLDEMQLTNQVAEGGTGNAGNINITTGTLSLTNGVQVFAVTVGQGNAGNITITARDRVSFDGEDSDGVPSGAFNQVAPGAIGQGGNISITTGTLSLTNGAQVAAVTFGQGNAGTIAITARDRMSFDGESSNRVPSRATSQVESGAIGQGGNVSITTGTLIFRNGARASSTTVGEGASGNLTVKATDSIQLVGTTSDGEVPSGLFSSTGGRGSAGNIDIDTKNLIILNGARASSSTTGEGAGGNLTVKVTDSVQLIGTSTGAEAPILGVPAGGQFPSALLAGAGNRGNAGNISIATRNLIVRDGGVVSSGTVGAGAGGDLTINAADSIQVIGVPADGLSLPSLLTAQANASGSAGDITLNTRQLIIGDGGTVTGQQTISRATGSVGNIRITADSLFVGNNASLTVEDRSTVARQRTESVGNIDIQSNSLKVDRGVISAETANTDGGNIGLGVQNILLLRNGGRISTNAGTAEAGGNGGNISINGNFIVAVPEENSNISANAFTGRGGNIRITTRGLFGIEPRSSTTTGLSSITASSQFGISGTITLNQPDVDPNRGLVQLPTELQDTSGLIASTCPADEGNSFAITGRGGIPEDPRQPLMGDSVWLDDRATAQPQSIIPNPTPQIVEAQGWIRDRNGQVTLVAAHPGGMTQPSQSILCSLLKHDR
ncbi:two-partner secretion domain-containing protein [Leptolyngbya sp. NIES-2104]|uniref:two-partner secretion domain-containing protein n=1 Tax=Leptolyngbya sp. NIES-2104 TaxID=1552121 RepID=UPI0006ECA9B6|nr:S-layer family protein [Leptolyngbya sp. NIES-2104]GAP94799.1 putative hemagglutinin-related protein [Leptolyngbya sp. NIES-2104]